MSFSDTFKNFGSGSPKGEKTTDLLAPGRGYGNERNNLSKIKIVALDRVTNDYVSEMLVNPNSITEQKSANWAKHYIPGQNDPLLQWISGSERVVSFSTKVTKDLADGVTREASDTNSDRYSLNFNSKISNTLELDDLDDIPIHEAEILIGLEEASEQTKPPITLSSVGSNIAAQFSNPFGSSDKVDEEAIVVEVDPRVKYFPLSIQKHLDYYRSLVMPRKSKLDGKSKSPTLIKLEMGDILGNRTVNERTKWVLLDYNITVTKMTPSLIPIDAIVNFTFIEYVDSNRSINSSEMSSLDDEYKSTEISSSPSDEFIFEEPGPSETIDRTR